MIIEVQHCVDCHLHNWCSRHNQAKYHEFYQKLEAKVKSIFKHAQMTKNQPPQHYQQRNALTTVGLQVHHYYDEQRDQETVFPRHGAFQIKVNGILIFSKLQSNLWPNLEKIANIMMQIRSELEAGKDISKFSLQYRLENNKQELVETYKKLIKFKINKRPYSSQFNASAYLPKGTVQNSPEIKQERAKRKNFTSLKKGGTNEVHRKSDVHKKPMIRFRNSKVEAVNMYIQFQEPKIEQQCQFPGVGKIVKNQYLSPHSKKKIQFKNDALHPIRSQPFELIGNNNSSALKLQKKPSRKLIIKVNDKKNQNFPHFNFKDNDNYKDSIDSSQKVIINQNPAFFTDLPTKKSLKSIKSVISIGDKLQNKGLNEIKVEDYTQKLIEKIEFTQVRPTQQSQIANNTQKLVNQQKGSQDQGQQQQQKFPKIQENIQNQLQVQREQKIIQCQEVDEGNFRKKGNVPGNEINDEIQYEQDFPADEFEELPIIANQCEQKAVEFAEQKYNEEAFFAAKEQIQQETLQKRDIFEQQQQLAQYQEQKVEQTYRQEEKMCEQDKQKQQQLEGQQVQYQSEQKLKRQQPEHQNIPVLAEKVDFMPIIQHQQAIVEEAAADLTIKQQNIVQKTANADLLPQMKENQIKSTKKIFQAQITQQQLYQKQQQCEYSLSFAPVNQKPKIFDQLHQFPQKQQENVEFQLSYSVPHEHQLQNISKLDLPEEKSVNNQDFKEPQKSLQQTELHVEQHIEDQPAFVEVPSSAPVLNEEVPEATLIEVQNEQPIERPEQMQAENVLKSNEIMKIDESTQKEQIKESNVQENSQNPIQNKQDNEVYVQKQSSQPKIEEFDKIVEQQDNREVVVQNIQANEQIIVKQEKETFAEPQPQTSQIQQTGKVQEPPKVSQKYVPLPSIHQISNKQSVRDFETLRSIPNGTESSIGLSSQIHSELNNVYELIQARIDARNSLEQEQPQ